MKRARIFIQVVKSLNWMYHNKHKRAIHYIFKGGEEMEAYCVKCKSKREMKDSQEVKLKNGKPAAKKIIGEFKAFAIKGNVIDLAVGVIIGAAFSKIVSSIVADIATPFIGMFIGGVNFQDLKINLPQFFGNSNPPVLNVGNFINTVIEFLHSLSSCLSL